jgi:DNA-binding response OmpR family regulator
VPNVPRSPTSKPCILLLEEYDALAVAIGSALRKFAPQHATQTAASVKTAEALAATLEPELIIIDVDPPWPKLTQLLSRWREAHPGARVLVIGATIPQTLMDERGMSGALQFLRKPFDVAELGAAVQALLGAWNESEASPPRGTLRSFNAVDAALLQCAGDRSVIVEVKKSATKLGEIHFHEGQPVHAESGKRSGVNALEEMFSWSEPQMREKEKSGAVSRTIDSPWAEVFLEALQGAQVRQSLSPAPARKAAPKPPLERAGPKIVVIDDTEMLLIFVEDVLTTANPQLQITTAGSGESGVREIDRVLPDLVLLDYSLPDFNGAEVCRRLLQNERTAGIPVLMMSGHGAEMIKTAARFENIVATIEKPFLSDALAVAVTKSLSAAPRPRRRMSPPDEPPAVQPAPVQKQVSPPPVAKPKPAPKIELPKSPETARSADMPVSVAPTTVTTSSFVSPEPPPIARLPRTPAPAPPPTRQPAPQTGIAPDVSIAAERQGPPPRPPATISPPIIASGMQEVVLGLFLEVVSLQLTPALRMGAIRTRPSSLTASLLVASPELGAVLPPKGFQLGPIELDRTGKISSIRVVPTVQPFLPLETRSAFQIGGVAVVPENSHERLQLTSAGNAPMRMHLQAKLELAGVELSSDFQVSKLVLKFLSNKVRVTLNAQAIGRENEGTTCEIAAVHLDGAGRLVGLLLNPVS